jgi:anti-sigma regulatory factor (Ser/Thr protein kinase)
LKEHRQETIDIRDSTDVLTCRHKVAHLAASIGLSDVDVGEIAIITSELTENVIKHAGGSGEMKAMSLEDERGRKGIEIVCSDDGPGISNPRAFEDGVSGVGTLGIGLGAVQRMSDSVDVSANKAGKGLKIVVRKWARAVQEPSGLAMKRESCYQFGARSRPHPGMKVNGDAYVMRFLDRCTAIVACIDGLGHGFEAHYASSLARAYIENNTQHDLPALMQELHKRLRHTRGAVVGLASIDVSAGTLDYLGVGNIDALIFENGKMAHMVSLGGIVGHVMRTLRPITCPWTENSCLIMTSDGIQSGWKSELNKDIMTGHPDILTSAILQQYGRANDDATVLAIRQKR